MGVPLMNNEVFAKLFLFAAVVFVAIGAIIWVCSL